MSKYEELSKLKELLDAGVLSKEEFETKKKKVFAKYLGNKIKTECMNKKFRNILFIR